MDKKLYVTGIDDSVYLFANLFDCSTVSHSSLLICSVTDLFSSGVSFNVLVCLLLIYLS